MKRSAIAVALLLISNFLMAQVSFPGAEGAGNITTGGRGTLASPTRVFIVTTLDDPTPTTTLVAGTFRHAVSTQSSSANPFTYRTIVFRVSGTIHLNNSLSVRANTTIAGQTAQGGGICIADHPVTIGGDNVIIRYMRFRLGDKNQA